MEEPRFFVARSGRGGGIIIDRCEGLYYDPYNDHAALLAILQDRYGTDRYNWSYPVAQSFFRSADPERIVELLNGIAL